jgi:hypothetical protein
VTKTTATKPRGMFCCDPRVSIAGWSSLKQTGHVLRTRLTPLHRHTHVRLCLAVGYLYRFISHLSLSSRARCARLCGVWFR